VSEGSAVEKGVGLCIALSDEVKAFLETEFSDVKFDYISTEEEFCDVWGDLAEADYKFVLCGSALGLYFPDEVGQLVSNECPETPNYFVGTTAASMRLEDLRKNGFGNAFLFPMDESELQNDLASLLNNYKASKKMRPCNLLDFDSEMELPFDLYVFLPRNAKYVKFVSKSQPLGEKRFARLRNYEVFTLFLEAGDMSKYAEMTAQILDSSHALAIEDPTELNKEHLRLIVRNLVLGVFDTSEASKEGGIATLNTGKKVVSAYISGSGSDDIYTTMAAAVGKVHSQYTHSLGVSILSTLLAIGLEFPTPEDLTFASFFHDISLWNQRTSDSKGKDDSKPMSAEDQKDYENHPERSLNILKEKKIGLREGAAKILLQHHEKYDGTGFPKKKSGDMVCLGAQILAVADQIDYLTNLKRGQKRMKLHEAIAEVKTMGIASPNLLAKIDRLFLKDRQKAKAA